MMKEIGRTAVIGRPFERPWLQACLFLLFSLLFWSDLPSCVMSAMISARPFKSFPRSGFPFEYTAYNDPWDYFGFVMANSQPYGNSDGYGTVAYERGRLFLSQSDRWYKRVLQSTDFGNTYYTGRYLDRDYSSQFWELDVLDRAMFSILGTNSQSHIAMIHGRNASALSYGNHPFVFDLRDRSLAFMHNGNCYSARNFMIQRVREINPDENWFVNHPSDFFGLSDPFQWVDSELLFHFIINHIRLNNDDILAGLGAALWELMPWIDYEGAPSFNFIMADGEKLYAFRNTPLTGLNSHYKLSYKGSENSFWAIRTLYPQPGDVSLNKLELVVFEGGRTPVHYPGLEALKPDPIDPEGEITQPGKAMAAFTPGLRLYPNPLRTKSPSLRLSVWIPELEGRASGSVNIYNMRAQLVYSRTLSTTDGKALLGLELPRLPVGLYLCSVKIGGQVRMAKFSIMD